MWAVPVGDRETERGGVEVGGARLPGVMTSWGDGLVPVDVDEMQGDRVTVRIVFVDD